MLFNSIFQIKILDIITLFDARTKKGALKKCALYYDFDYEILMKKVKSGFVEVKRISKKEASQIIYNPFCVIATNKLCYGRLKKK